MVGAAMFVAVEAVWLVAGLPGGDIVSDAGAIIVAVIAAVLGYAAAMRTPDRLRVFWTLLTATMALTAVGRLTWTLARVTRAPDTLPNTPVVGVFFIAGVLTGTAALLTCLSAPRSLAGRVRLVLDGMIVALSLVPVSWVLVLRNVASTPLTDPVRTLGLFYPMLDLMQLTILVAVSGPGRPARRPLAIIGASVGIRVIADAAYSSMVAGGDYYLGHPIDVCWPLSYLLVAAATSHRLPTAIDDPDELVESSAVPWWRVIVPYLPVGGGIVAVILAQRPSGRTPPLIFFTVMALLSALAIRQGLAAYENRRLALRLRRLAYEDSLTGLANRLLFTRQLRRALNNRRQVAVLLLDLDGFKQVNDRFGHATGDALLASVAARMAAAVGGDGIIARIGGDEFAVLVENSGPQAAERVAQRLLTAVGPSASEEEVGVHPSASIGIADYGPQHSGHADLLRDADIAMYAAKAAGKSAYRICTPALREAVVTRAELIADLRRALDEGEQLELDFQPIVDLATGTVRGAEALVRWRHPRRGLLPPALFLPLAEEAGLIVAVDRWVMHQACRAAATWQDVAPDATVAVNLAPAHLRRADITATVAEATASAGLTPRVLTLELTETALIEETDTVLERLHLLRELGVRIAIDDFGTGYSSLSYLHRIPATELKIDRSFVDRLDGGDARAYATVDLVSRLAEAFDMVVVAEGVETDNQHAAVTAIGCPQGQGYRYGRPGKLADLRTALTRGQTGFSKP